MIFGRFPVQRARLVRQVACGLTALTLCSSCLWSRFTELKQDTPVVRLEPSKSYSGKFGAFLAVAANDDKTELYIAGSPGQDGGLVYSLGVAENPQPNPTDESHCPGKEGADDCEAVTQPVGLHVSFGPSGNNDLCFISGFGTLSGRDGLWTRCDNDLQFVYPVPDDVRAGLLAANDPQNPKGLRLATNRGRDQLILAVTSGQRRAWFYEPLSGDPIDLETPVEAGSDFGGAVAVAEVDGSYLLGISAPDTGELWIYRVSGDAVESTFCLQAGSSFGRRLATGDVDGDGFEDLLVGEDSRVVVLSGESLSAVDSGATPSACADLGDSDLRLFDDLECASTDEASGCGPSDFGAALAVVDVDGDGTGEIFVGAPKMTVREEARAGAVISFSASGKFIDALIVSDAREDDLLGTSLVAFPQGDREALAVGATGSREVYLFYCAAGSDGAGSKRCE